MKTKLDGKCTSDICRREMEMLAEVLNKYDFTVDSIEKVRSAYKICTDKGIFCLKRVSHGYKKAKKSYHIMKYLSENGWSNIAEFYRTKDQKTIIKQGGAAFYLTYWIEGRETSLAIPDEILGCSELLADFHNNAKGLDPPKHVKIKSHVKKWRKTFMNCKNDLIKFMEHIDKLGLKSEFDYAYRSSIDYFLNEAEYAIKILDHSRYSEICRYYKDEKYICHNSYYYQNIMVDKNGKFFVIDLESCQFDMPVSDLGKLIRRVLSKKRYRWDFDLCRKMIERYCKVRAMSVEEYEILLSMLVFPHKFWKLGRKRYVKNKNWSEEKYENKLKRLLREKQYKEEFINCYINFYHLNIV